MTVDESLTMIWFYLDSSLSLKCESRDQNHNFKEAKISPSIKWLFVLRLRSVRPDVALGTTVQTLSPEPRDDPPSCFSCSEASQIDASDRVGNYSSAAIKPREKSNIRLPVEGL